MSSVNRLSHLITDVTEAVPIMKGDEEVSSMANYAVGRFLKLPIVYLDTNIYGMLAEAPECWGRIRSWLLDNEYLLGLSGANALELVDARWLPHNLACLLISTPSVVLKTVDMLVDEEIGAYPAKRTTTDVLVPLLSQILEPDGPARIMPSALPASGSWHLIPPSLGKFTPEPKPEILSMLPG